MSRVAYPANSPYSSTPQSSWYLGFYKWRNIPPNSADQLYTLLPRHTHRPDTLSFDLYGTPAYYWVFAVRNPYLRAEPIWDFVAGQQLWVPNNDYLRRIIG